MIRSKWSLGATATTSVRCALRMAAILTAIVLVVPAPDASFGQTLWTAGTGDWFDPNNWSLDVPNSASGTSFDARIDNGGTAQLLTPGGSVRRLRMGTVLGAGHLLMDASTLTVTQNLHLNEGSAGPSSMTVRNGSTITSPSMVVGHTSDASSTLLITDPGSIVTTNEINVGQAGLGTGALMIEAGGSLSDIDGFIARFALSIGSATVSGTGSTWTNSGILRVGHIGNGTLSVANGGSVSSNFGYVSVGEESTSTVTVSGTGSAWANSSELHVGYEGTGTLAIDSGGSVSGASGSIGGFSGASGTVTVSGAGSQWTNSSGMFVGNSGVGSLTITGGADVSDDYAYIANAAGSQGTITVDGAGSTWINDGQLYVGFAGSGSLNIANGGQVTNTSFGSVNIGAKAGSSGTVTMEGAGSRLTTNNALILGGEGGVPTDPGGDGIMTIRAGAQVFSNTGYVAYAPGSESGVSVEGPDSTWTTNQLLFVGNHGVGNLQIMAGGQVHTTAGDAVIGGSFGSTGSGSVVVDGAGSALTLSSADPSGLYVGDDGPGVLTVTNGGTVSVESFNGIQIGDQGTVMGDGTLDAWVYNHGIVAPGTSVGTLTIVNSPYRQGPTGTLKIELASATSYDKLNFPGGGAFLEGGTLDVTLLDGYAPSFGTSFDLMDWHQFGSITGAFATLNLPDLPGTLDWDTSQLYSAGVLRVISTGGFAGDYNQNGIVDASDYAVWRKGLGTTFTPEHYNIWRANFGATAGSASGVTGSDLAADGVPEPTSLVLLALGGLFALLRHGRPAVRTSCGAGFVRTIKPSATSHGCNGVFSEPATLALMMFTAAGWCLRRGRAA
jgi:T5SS/PEP-CTERM-associated repeat protein